MRRPGVALYYVLVIVLLCVSVVGFSRWYSGSWVPSLSPTAQQPAPVPTADPAMRPYVPLCAPTSMTFRRGANVLFSARIAGAMMVDFKQGQIIDPEGNDPYWIGTTSKVGTGMGTAWFAGHNNYGSPATILSRLKEVRQGDFIDMVCEGVPVRFVVTDTHPQPWTYIPITNDPNTVKVVSCTDAGGSNIIVTAEALTL